MCLDLRHLRHLCAVVESGSLGRASVALGISEPGLSKSVRALEDRLAVRLLDRGSKGMVPTAAGQALYAGARAILAEVEHATTEIAELRGFSRGVVRVGAQPSLASVLPRAIDALQASRAAVRVVAQIGTTDCNAPGRGCTMRRAGGGVSRRAARASSGLR
jgi:DNA-binding transcriptional LysR family regulator